MPEERPRSAKLRVDLVETLRALGQGLYPRKELILRELIQNASDALQLRVASQPGFLPQARITLEVDGPAAKLSVSDNGIGMKVEDLELAFGSIGSTNKKFLAAAAKSDDSVARELIGQFGIGLLSTFLVADQVEIVSKPATGFGGFRAVGSSDGSWTISPASDWERGTTIALHVRSEDRFLLERRVVTETVHHYCQLVPFPIYFKGDQEPIYPGRRRSVSTIRGADLAAEVARVLSREELPFEMEPSIGGLQPDFVVYGPDGRIVIVEAKSWTTDPGYFSRALEQAARYQAATGADGAFVVLANAKRENPSQGVVGVEGLVRAIREEFAKPKAQPLRHKPIDRRGRTVFAAMPFTKTYDDVFFVAMAYAAEKIQASCVRVDFEEFSGDIVNEIQARIRESVAVVADLSESKPNVLYETGYAHALGKPVAHVCSTPLDQLPFDVRNWSTIKYEVGQTIRLRERLADRLKAITQNCAS